MSKIYYLWDTKNNKMMEQRICSSYEQAEKFRNGLTGYDLIPLSKCEHCEIKEKEVSDKCICEDFNQTTFIVIKHIGNEIQVVTTSNYFGIHDLSGLPIFIDIEKEYPNYELMTLEYFHNNFKVITSRNTIV